MKKKSRYTSAYQYNPLNPLNWTLLTIINVSCCIILFIDWLLGFNVPIDSINTSFLTNITGNNEFFLRVFPIFSLIFVLLISPWLNREIDDSPFYGVILIRVILYLGSCQYTFLGEIGEFVLTLTCSVVIVTVLVFMTFFSIEDPVNHVQGMLIALILLFVNFLVNLIVFGWRIEETWASLYIVISIIGIFLIHKDYIIIGALPIFIMAIFNDYIITFDINGFDVGAEIMKFFSGFLAISAILSR